MARTKYTKQELLLEETVRRAVFESSEALSDCVLSSIASEPALLNEKDELLLTLLTCALPEIPTEDSDRLEEELFFGTDSSDFLDVLPLSFRVYAKRVCEFQYMAEQFLECGWAEGVNAREVEAVTQSLQALGAHVLSMGVYAEMGRLV